MGKAASLFQQGAMTPKEYSQAINTLSRDLDANAAGFGNMQSAVARADAILKGMETSTERYQNSLRELSQLFQLGALGPDQYAEAVKRMNAAYQSTLPTVKNLAAELKAQNAGFTTMSQAVSRADSVLRGLETNTERYSQSVKELHQLRKAGTITEDQFSAALKRTKAAFVASLPPKATADDLRARALGFDSMSSAMQRADAIIKTLATDTERYGSKLNEINKLTQLGKLTVEQQARALSSMNPAAFGAATAMKSLGGQAGMIGRMNLGGFTSQLNLLSQATAPLSTAVPHVAALTSNLSSLASLGGPIAAVAGSITAVVLSLRNAMKETTRVSDISLELGIDPQELLGLEHAARKTGVQISTLQSGLQRLTIHGAEAAAGSKKMLDVMDRLGIDAKKFNEATPDVKFRAVAEALESIQNPAERTRIAFQLFGSEGVKLLSTLKLGVAGLDEARAKTILFGNSLSKDGVGAVGAWQESVANLSLAWDGFSQRLLDGVSPAVNLLSSAMSKATTTFVFLQKAITSDTFGASVVAGWEKAIPPIDAVNTKLLAATQTISKAQQQINEWKKNQQPIMLDVKVVEDPAAKLKTLFDDLRATVASVESAMKGVVSPQEKLLEVVQKINAAYEAGFVTLQKRNALLAGAQQQIINQPLQDERKKRFDDMQAQLKSSAASITNSVKTPFESFTDKVAELQKLQKMGLITPEVASRAFAAAREEFGKSLENTNAFKPQNLQGPAALDGGPLSAQVSSAHMKTLRDVRTADDQLAETRKQTKKLDELVKKGILIAAKKW